MNGFWQAWAVCNQLAQLCLDIELPSMQSTTFPVADVELLCFWWWLGVVRLRLPQYNHDLEPSAWPDTPM